MKGVIFNAIEETVRSEQGEDAWDDLLDAAGLTGAYTSLGTYPDEQVYALVACRELGAGPQQGGPAPTPRAPDLRVPRGAQPGAHGRVPGLTHSPAEPQRRDPS